MAVKFNSKLRTNARQTALRITLVSGLMFASLLLVTRTSRAAPDHQYVVALNGNDDNPGTFAQPWRTIQHALEAAHAGDTICVRTGIYTEAIQMQNSGAPGRLITLMACPGERPIIDGQYLLPSPTRTGWAKCNQQVAPPKCFHWLPLVGIAGDYILFDGFEIRHSAGRGLVVARPNGRPTAITIRNTRIHDQRNAGVLLHNADNITFTDNVVWHSGDYATADRTATDLNWPVAVSGRATHNVSYRNNRIFNNWGEGLDTGVDSVNVLVENNEIYDNFALQLYIHRTQDALIQRNLIYCTNAPDFQRNGDIPTGIVVNNEQQFAANALVNEVSILHNVVVGCHQNIGVWAGGDAQYGVENLVIAHNTLVNATTNQPDREPLALYIAPAAHKNLQIHHNIIVQTGRLLVSAAPSVEVQFDHNAWSQAPAKIVMGVGDIVGDVQLAHPFAPLAPGAVVIDWYKPLAASPVITAAIGPLVYFQRLGHD